MTKEIIITARFFFNAGRSEFYFFRPQLLRRYQSGERSSHWPARWNAIGRRQREGALIRCSNAGHLGPNVPFLSTLALPTASTGTDRQPAADQQIITTRELLRTSIPSLMTGDRR